MFKAIIFDMDGVLLDSESLCDRNWAIVFKEMGLEDDKHAIEQCRGTNKTDTRVILQKLYGDKFSVDAFMQRTHDLFYEEEEKNGVPLLPYAAETLERLSKKYRLALASSTRAVNIKRQLSRNKIYDYFETVTAGDMVTHSKPDPEIYKMAMESLGLKPEECLAIEDSPNGIKSAVAAGMKVIMVPDRIKPNEETNRLSWKVFNNLKETTDFLLDLE